MNYLSIILILRKSGFHITYQSLTQQCVLLFAKRGDSIYSLPDAWKFNINGLRLLCKESD